ncbi:pyridoxal phosphate-dependent aminotransferase [Helicobacter suis]|uniref:Aminotransferase n=2 Tax=Helicobacter suis TaxID=104628 RepID=E7G4G6_9HELI|nr:pyridoxal phosphate-dependent aminotransferase [Helicobacter suis]EFX41659.1 aspartate aminotransferase [Helicobacter suis HS5]EFX43242.1 aspartate aminotransferase [Helicobacter suis HS1]BCD44991.1 Aspartate aminotransferase AspB [Helicobacter suis]BCD46825.1 Aspartate aminotransferase AspB [Helicobacter suis]BCD48582.1 Aspartate aminotransferase AspB [Helicobacter suis]
MYASKVENLAPSKTIAISTLAQELKAQGKDVLSFSAGEPDFDTPNSIKEAAIKAIEQGFSKYTAVKGVPELLKAISHKFKQENGLEYAPDEVMVSNGAKQCLFNAIQALLNSGDEVIIPAPYWVSYPEIVNYSGGKSVFLPTSLESSFKITPEQLKTALTPKTKMLILSSPSNPTGMIYSKEELQALANVLEKTNVWVLSDEIYEKLVYEGVFYSFGALPNMLDRTISINGLSKAFSMTGWRVGYLGTKDKTLLKHMVALQSHSTSNINSITQRAALAALSGCAQADIETMRLAFKERRDVAFGTLREIPGLTTIKPQGAFYLWIKIPGDSTQFCQQLLEEQGVAFVPGSAFGMEGFVRMSYACSLEQIKQGLERLKVFMQKR